jgi:hypothetical protein
MKKLLLIITLFIAHSAAAFDLSGDAKAVGKQIAVETELRDVGFKDSESILNMVLINNYGEKTTRKMRQRVFEIDDETLGDYSLNIFDEPADIKGTALLSHAKILEADDQWIYLPALKRVKRISSKNKSGPFMGSEFAYEDFTSREIGKYDYKYIRTEKCGEFECYVTERYPLYENSGYTKHITWTDSKYFQMRRSDYYDRKGELLKTLTFSNYKQYLGKYWRARTLTMKNHQNGKSTILSFDEFKFKNGFTENDFDKNALKRIR